MKSKAIFAFSTILLCATLGASKEAHAWKPQAPFCYINCGLPVGEISATPSTVLVPSYSETGTVSLKWKWDFINGPAMFPLACIYVRANAEAHFYVVQCEWPGNTNYTTLPWIAAGSLYTFVLSPYAGNIVLVGNLYQLAGNSSVDVVGVVSDGGGGGGGDPPVVIN